VDLAEQLGEPLHALAIEPLDLGLLLAAPSLEAVARDADRRRGGPRALRAARGEHAVEPRTQRRVGLGACPLEEGAARLDERPREPLLHRGHPRTELLQRPFRPGDGAPQRGHARAGLLERPLERLAFRVQLEEERVPEDLRLAGLGRPDERRARAHRQPLEALHERVPVARRGRAGQALDGADLEDRGHRTPQALRQHALGEPERLAPLGVGEPVRLVEHHDQLVDAPRDLLDEAQLVARDGRIGAEDHERRVDVGHEGAGGGGAGGRDRGDAGRVHQAHARREQRARDEDLDAGDALLVARVLLLGDVRRQRARVAVLPVPLAEADPRGDALAETHDGDGGGDGHDPHRQDGVADERVDQGGFPPLELAHARDVEAPLAEPLRHGRGLARELDGSGLAREAFEVGQCPLLGSIGAHKKAPTGVPPVGVISPARRAVQANPIALTAPPLSMRAPEGQGARRPDVVDSLVCQMA